MEIVNTIRSWVESVIGTYTPNTYEVVVVDASGATVGRYDAIASGMAGVDWQFLATAALLLIVVWSVFRLLGVLLQNLSSGRRV